LLAAARPEADGTPLIGRADVAEAVIMEGQARYE
jgi:hypothetical protein